MKTFENYGHQYYVEFKVKLWESGNGFTNIMHVTNGPDNDQQHGNRFPAIWFGSSNFFLFSTSAKGIQNYGEGYNGDPQLYYHGVKLNQDYHIIVSQQYNANRELIYSIIINNVTWHSVENNQPKVMDKVYLYFSDPWYSPIGDIGEIYDITVSDGKYKSCCSVQKNPIFCNQNVTAAQKGLNLATRKLDSVSANLM